MTIEEYKTQIYIQNLESISQFYQLSHTFKTHWQNDRETFFKELAAWIKKNTKASDFSIIFNDIKSKSDEAKPQLTQSVLFTQEDQWHKSPLTQAHLDLVEKYKETCQKPPHIFEVKNQHITLLGSLGKSPFMIMAKCERMTTLQEALITGLFNSLNQLLAK